MQLHIFENADQASLACATVFAAQIMKKPDSVLGLATGSTPVKTYENLVAWHKQGALDFSECISYNLDEYVGIDYNHEQSYHRFMKDHLFDHVNIKESHVPDGNNQNPKAECKRYDKAIKNAGGLDILFLGIGRNGHIGFNEPADHFVLGTHIVDLTPSTIEANRRFFDSADQVPRQAMSLGIGAIMDAKTVVLVAFGEEKAQAIHDAVKGAVTPMVQASILQMHKNVIFFVDKAAASKL